MAEVLRRALRSDPELRMSANNAGDVLRFFVREGIAERVAQQKSAFPCYQLTERGRHLRRLLLGARVAGGGA